MGAGEPSDLALLRATLSPFFARGALDSFGLLLCEELHRWPYDETPRNSLTFASTGGDGVHYGLLVDRAAPGNDSPVVMTVPMADEPNRIVGSNLRDFLGLGLTSGYFVLEQLQYDLATTIQELESGFYLAEMNDEERSALEAITWTFAVTGWHDHAARLQALAAEFAGRLDVAPT